MGPGSMGVRSNAGSRGADKILLNRPQRISLKRDKQTLSGQYAVQGGTLTNGSSFPSMHGPGLSSLKARKKEGEEHEFSYNKTQHETLKSD